MTLDRRLTGGLAWAGLLLVVAVPSADALTSVWSPAGANLVEPVAPAKSVASVKPVAEPQVTVKPAQTAAITKPVAVQTPAAKPAPVTADPAPVQNPVVQPTAAPAGKPSASAVDSYIASGKQLPSYISGGEAPKVAIAPAPVISQPAPIVPEPAAPAGDTEVASIAPQPELVAPVPMPASMRPHPRAVPKVVASTNHGDEDDGVVGAQDLRNWESGPLSEFLAQRNQRRHGDGDYIEYNADDGDYRQDNQVIYFTDNGFPPGY